MSKKKSTPSYVEVEYTCFQQRILVWYGCSQEKMHKDIDELVGGEDIGIPPIMKNIQGITFEVDSEYIQFFVCWTKFKEIPLLVHELNHGVHRLLNCVGIKEVKDSSEASSYCLEYAVQEVLDKEGEICSDNQ